MITYSTSDSTTGLAIKIPPSEWTTFTPKAEKYTGISLEAPFSEDESVRECIGGLVQEGYWVKATGSRVTKDGWTEESDWDYVVYDPEGTLDKKIRHSIDWSTGESGNGVLGISLTSYKSGPINLILTSDDAVWKKYIIATNLLRLLNPKTKKERIALFDSVFGNDKDLKAVEF
jgi:hypothetical protein